MQINPTWGELYFNHANIFRMFPLEQMAAGRLKVNYTDGATAASLGVTAGIPSTGAPSFVDDTETKVYGAIASQAYVDLPSLQQGIGGDAARSANSAIQAIYREWVGQVISAQAGETYGQIWGARDFVENVTQEGDSMTVSGSYAPAGFTDALLKQDIGKMAAKLPQDGSLNVCITSPEGYEAIYKAIEVGAGGLTPAMTAMEAFGFSALTYRGIVFFVSDKVDTNAAATGSFSDFWFFNTGNQGCIVTVPDTVPLILSDGPKKTVGKLSDVWDIVLNTQILYQGHHSAGRMQSWITA